MAMKRWILAAALVGAGCGPSAAPVLQEIDLKDARRLESKGKVPEAILAYAEAAGEIGARDDVKAQLAWARILEALLRMKAPEVVRGWSPELKARLKPIEYYTLPESEGLSLTKAARCWVQVLSSGLESLEVQQEGAVALAETFRRKAAEPGLWKTRVDAADARFHAFYRRLLRACATKFELYVLAQQPAGRRDPARLKAGIEGLVEDLLAAAADGKAPEVPAQWWRDRAEQLRTMLADLLRNPDGLVSPPEVRTFVQASVPRHLELATQDLDRAVREISTRGDPRLAMEAYERGFLNLVLAREVILEPTPKENLTFEILSSHWDGYRRLTTK